MLNVFLPMIIKINEDKKVHNINRRYINTFLLSINCLMLTTKLPVLHKNNIKKAHNMKMVDTSIYRVPNGITQVWKQNNIINVSVKNGIMINFCIQNPYINFYNYF